LLYILAFASLVILELVFLVSPTLSAGIFFHLFVAAMAVVLIALGPRAFSQPIERGWNWYAIIALCVAVAPVVPGFIRAATTPGGQIADPTFFDTLYTYAWFVTFGLGFVIYYVLMNGQVKQE
jgi:hypothetical protein